MRTGSLLQLLACRQSFATCTCNGHFKRSTTPVRVARFRASCVRHNRADTFPITTEDIKRRTQRMTHWVHSLGVQAYCAHPLPTNERFLGTPSFWTRNTPFFPT